MRVIMIANTTVGNQLIFATYRNAMSWEKIENKAPKKPINPKAKLMKTVIIVKIMDLINFSSILGRKTLNAIRKLINVPAMPTICSGLSKINTRASVTNIKKVKYNKTLEFFSIKIN